MITIRVRGLEELNKWLMELPAKLRGIATEAAAEYLVGDMSHGLKHYPGYKYVTRADGFPNLSYTTRTGKVVRGFASARQHRYVMAAIAEGKILPGFPRRTGNLQRSWKVTKTSAYSSKITSSSPYAQYVVGDDTQTQMHGLIGWRQIANNIQDNIRGAIRSANAKVKEWLKTNK